MKTRLISFICGLMVLFPLAALSQSSINGIVENEEGIPINGAKVSIQGTYLMVYTGSDGRFQFEKIKDGTYALVVSSKGNELFKKDFTISGEDLAMEIIAEKSPQLIDEVLIESLKIAIKDIQPIELNTQNPLEINNYGQDLPYLLRYTPSVVVTSDAGAGIGYTGIRIRGVDPTRTNVTINGIPLNDAESHGVYWVNIPDIVSSTRTITVQRGVGTSANGVAAFGASINIETNEVKKTPYAVVATSGGSFNSLRTSVMAGTGLINEKFTLDTRLSRIVSDGYVDRSSSNLRSLYVSAAWLGKKSNLRLNVFAGKEKTYQSWYGTPESVINGDISEINAYADRNYVDSADRANLLNSGRTYNFYTYENEVDDYQQDHYQLILGHKFSPTLSATIAAHYTRGRGFYEQYRANDDFATYGFTPVIFSTDTITTTDLIRRRWLDNHFYGTVFALNYGKEGLDVSFGGSVNQYLGGHFGEVIWAEYASSSEIRDRYYENDATKTDLSSYIKAKYMYKDFMFYGDFQFRHIDYNYLGVASVNGSIEAVDQEVSYNFINPKGGIKYFIDDRQSIISSVGVANREPTRGDFIQSTPENRPSSEQLIDFELGYRFYGRKLMIGLSPYYMHYNNQLILTGQINDVGGYTKTNVDKSSRAGIEFEIGYQPHKKLDLTGNFTFSQNKVAAFNEFIDNYDIGGQDTIAHTNTDLAFSPNIIAAAGISYEPVKGLYVMLLGKYVGKQFLDNTSTDTRKIDGYFISTFDVSYTIKDVLFKEIQIGVRVNNLFNKVYESNGYTWGYIYGGELTVENFYYPQAGRNFHARLTLKF
jgi:iron complex outermembrane receptor protein